MSLVDSSMKTIFVTGCSTGIGAEIVNFYLNKGYKVIATARRKADIDHLHSLGAHAIHCELSDQVSIDQCIGEVCSITDKLDCIICNAAYGQAGAVADLDFSTLHYQFSVNVFGTIELLRRLIPLLKLSSVAKVIFISSILGVVTSPYLGAYCASKHALESLITALRMEFYGQSIYFSSVRPGQIKTNFRSTAETMFDKTIAKSAAVDMHSYESFRHKVELNKQKDRGLPPAAVVKTIDRVVNAKRPKRAYYVTYEAHFLGRLQRFLPSFVYVNYII